MSDIRDSSKNVIQYSNWLWLVFACVYIGVFVHHYIEKMSANYHHMLIEACVRMELTIFLLQFIIYHLNKNDGKWQIYESKKEKPR